MATQTTKKCVFCEKKTEPTYTDSAILRKYISDRCRIYPRSKTANCSRHQRMLTREIKHARFLALLPYVARPQ